jgi:hypothetical protein
MDSRLDPIGLNVREISWREMLRLLIRIFINMIWQIPVKTHSLTSIITPTSCTQQSIRLRSRHSDRLHTSANRAETLQMYVSLWNLSPNYSRLLHESVTDLNFAIDFWTKNFVQCLTFWEMQIGNRQANLQQMNLQLRAASSCRSDSGIEDHDARSGVFVLIPWCTLFVR